MKLPALNELSKSRDMISVFGGYNHNLCINDGEFYDMKNLTSTHYPVLSPRPVRGIFASPENPQGMIAKDTLCYIDGRYFIFNQYRIDMDLSTDEDQCPKQLVSMGAYVIIMPDKKYFNTADISDYGNIEAVKDTTTSVTFELCTVDGSAYDAVSSNIEPVSPENLQYWIDTSCTPHTLKQYSESSKSWVSVATTYVKISSTGIGVPFDVYDAVSISGIENLQLSDLNNNTSIIWAKGDDYIVVIGILDSVITQSSAINVSRRMPRMDFVIENENRLWGCRYGVNHEGKVVNEIYASKLGDFKNWNSFLGISTDSYAVSLGTDGQFTGAIKHSGSPLFFKENYMHKIYGNFPSNYQVQTIPCRGVQKGSHKSLAIVNEVLFYKSRSAICAYDGSLPTEVSAALGDVSYHNAVAGANGNKYYISMMDTSGKYHFFVYDVSKGLWHKEDNTKVLEFCSCRGEMYFIDISSESEKHIRTVLGSGSPDTTDIKWMAETGNIGMEMPDNKFVGKLNVRMSLDTNSRVYFSIQYDSSGSWEQIYAMPGTSLRSFTVPIRPRRCDHFSIKIEGIGDAKIFSITKIIEQGSDSNR